MEGALVEEAWFWLKIHKAMVTFRHRETNKVAHCVAALAPKDMGMHVWVRDALVGVRELISLDVMNGFV